MWFYYTLIGRDMGSPTAPSVLSLKGQIHCHSDFEAYFEDVVKEPIYMYILVVGPSVTNKH